MEKQITITILGILMIASAAAMYGGETINFTTKYADPFYIVTGNSSDLEGMNVTVENQTITISLAQNFKPDNFTLIFMDDQTNEIVKEVRVGGGSRTKYVDRNITVIQPLFLDRIINNTIELDNCTNKTIIIPEEIIEKKPNFVLRFWKWIWGIFT